MSRTPQRSSLLNLAAQAALEHVHTAIPAKVVAYDAASQTADVKPLVMRAFTGEDGERQASPLPVVPRCPVFFPGSAKFGVTFALEPGDTGLLVFSESSLDKWMERGDDVDPTFDHRFSLADGVFFPGVMSLAAARDGAPTDRIVLGRHGGTRVEVSDDSVELGSPGGPGVARTGDAVKVDGMSIMGVIAAGGLIDADGNITGGSGTVKAAD